MSKAYKLSKYLAAYMVPTDERDEIGNLSFVCLHSNGDLDGYCHPSLTIKESKKLRKILKKLERKTRKSQCQNYNSK